MRLDWVWINPTNWLGFDGVNIVARIEKVGSFQYQWWVGDETAVAQTARDAMTECERQASE